MTLRIGVSIYPILQAQGAVIYRMVSIITFAGGSHPMEYSQSQPIITMVLMALRIERVKIGGIIQ